MGELYSIEIASIYGAHTRQGLIELKINDEKIQMDVAKAREILQMLWEAIEAAVTDELLIRFLTEKVGMPFEQAGAALLDFRELRQGTRKVAPTTGPVKFGGTH